MYKKLLPSHPLISSPVGKRNRNADLGGTLELSVKPHTWIPGDLQATSTSGRTRYYFTLYFKRLFSQIHSYYHLLFVQGCVQELSETKQIKTEMQAHVAKKSCPSFSRPSSPTKQEKEQGKELMEGKWENSSSYGVQRKISPSLSRLCLCRWTWTTEYQNKTGPTQLYYLISSVKV